MNPDVTVSFAGHTIHFSNFDLALACGFVFALAVVELAFSFGRRIILKRRTNELIDQLERAVHVLERAARELTARSFAANSASDGSAPPVPQPQPAEWRKSKSSHSSPYSMFGR